MMIGGGTFEESASKKYKGKAKKYKAMVKLLRQQLQQEKTNSQ
jgi:hypothetical protein